MSYYKPLIIVGLITLCFILLHYPQINNPVNADYGAIPKTYLDSCDVGEFPYVRAPVKAWLLCASQNTFGEINLLPFIFSTSLIPLSWILGICITKNYTRALTGPIIISTSTIVGYLGTTAALSSDWVFFLILSIIFAYKRPEISGVFFFISVAAKGLPLLLLPFIVYLILKSQDIKKSKAILSFSSAAFVVFLIYLSGNHSIVQEDGLGFHPETIADGIKNSWFVFRSDPVQLIIIPASIIILIFSSSPYRLPLIGFIVWYYSLAIMLPLLSWYSMFDYRMIPLIVISGVSLGLFPENLKSTFSNKSMSLGLSWYNK